MSLEPGYELCPRCQGKGYHDEYDQTEYPYYGTEECTLCKGIGAVDWVTNIFKQNWEKDDLEFIEEMEEEKFDDDISEEILEWKNSSFDIDINYQLGTDND